MTHTPYNPVVFAITWALILVFMSGLPAAAVVERLYQFNARIGTAAAIILTPAWLVTWVQATRLSVRHATLQREAARASDCLGYGDGMMPERCAEAINGPAVTPDGFLVWMGAAVGFGIIGLLVIFGEEAVDKYATGAESA